MGFVDVGGEEPYGQEVVVFHEGLLVACEEAEEGEDECYDAAEHRDEGGETHREYVGVVLKV